jgi:hypothetical protein
VRLHFRYSVEYLIETGLLSPQGAVRLLLLSMTGLFLYFL